MRRSRSTSSTSRWALRSWSSTARSPRCTPRSTRSIPTPRRSRDWSRSSAARRRSNCPSARSRSSRPHPRHHDTVHDKEPSMPPKKKVAGLIKLQIQAGQATPAPPVGPALGQHGVNIMEFCKAYNAATESERGNVVPVEITVYEDRSFTFITKTPPASQMIKKAAGVGKGSATPHTDKVASITSDQVREIAQTKLEDLNANDIEAAMKIVAGTARSMGITVNGN